MIAALFRNVTEISPKMTEALWKGFYELAAIFFKKQAGWKFMNYGYALPDEITGDYEQLCAKLYSHLCDQTDMQKVNLLEVGCGRGGGCQHMLNYPVSQITGLDFSKNAIKFCKKNYKESQLKFVVGSAESLPFDNGSFDVVINVESSHCYGNRATFFAEVNRVLKPGGVFLYADFMGREHYHKRPVQLQNSGFQVINDQEITPQVLKSMNLSSDYKEALLKKLLPTAMHGPIKDFAGLPGSNIYNHFMSGNSIYFSIIAKKKTLEIKPV